MRINEDEHLLLVMNCSATKTTRTRRQRSPLGSPSTLLITELAECSSKSRSPGEARWCEASEVTRHEVTCGDRFAVGSVIHERE